MPTELPDVNVLIAMVDPEHIHHDIASRWFDQACQKEWATCPVTENGLIRVISSPAYPGISLTPHQATELLRTLIANHAASHTFWEDSTTLRDEALYATKAIAGHRQTTDCYLLGLCQARKGVLVTLDAAMHTAALQARSEGVLRVLSG